MKLTAEQEDKLMFSEWERIRLPDGEGTSLGYFRAGWACCKLNASTAEDEKLTAEQRDWLIKFLREMYATRPFNIVDIEMFLTANTAKDEEM